MPNIRKRKTDRGLATSEIYELASEECRTRKASLRDAAKSYNLCYVSLYRYMKKKNQMIKEGTPGNPKVGYVGTQRVFSDAEEINLQDYLLHCSAVNYGLTTKEVRKLAYEMAKKNDMNMPSSWETN